MLEFLELVQECAPTVAPQTMAAVVRVESSYNPYAIGVVGGRLARQPADHLEAVATAKALAADGWNFSMGVAQVNRHNLPKHQITYEQAFDACTNLRVGSKILEECYVRASKRSLAPQVALQAALSCYYSGNFTRGFQPDVAGKPSYVQKVLASAEEPIKAIPVVPSIQTGSEAKAAAQPAQEKRLVVPPSDNGPVLLRPAKAADSDVVRLQPVMKGPAGTTPDSITDENEASTKAAAPENVERRSSAIVF